ncbi:MAG: glucose-6-phosphate dehydrogenase assembly protein OpcA [Pseudanabaena sp.]|nr:MAG: glucose-6-phosphate dehydrogenase assembly protein OpcA [Pseudanabaena sp.]
MNAQSNSVVSLQAPKDVSVSQVEAELSKIWQSYGENSAARATTFNLLVYEPATVGAASRMASVDAIASQSPCRVIDLVTLDEEDQGISAQVAAYCPIQKTRSSLICGEYITLSGAKRAFERVHSILPDLLIPDLPVFLWWKDSPAPNTRMFEKMVNLSDRLIVDSATFSDSEADLLKIQSMIQSSTQIADLNWQRLAPWQELTAQAFDQPDRRSAVWEIDGITIDYEKGNCTQALMFLGWIASRLDWLPIERNVEGGDYDIQHIMFEGRDGIKVRAELAAIPVGDAGEVIGDLIGLRLTASNQNSDACNVFCSESTGCMRMEAGGVAQNYRVHQVSPLSDQSADTLLGQQLQRWGREVLYEESLLKASRILAL